MLPSQRDVVILNHLEQQGIITVAQIRTRCNCSNETARRDLRRLEKQGMVERTYGGARRIDNVLGQTAANGIGSLEARSALMDRADVLVVAPSQTAATRRMVDRARRMGVPIIAESHSYPGATVVVAVDDFRAGVELGQWVVGYARRHLGGRINVLDVSASLANTNARSRGFALGLRDLLPDDLSIQRVDSQGLRDFAQRIAADALNVHPEINVIFGINDDSALGALQAYRAAGLDESRLLVVCFGFEGSATKDLLEAGGPLKATVAMFPELVGRICVDAAICAHRERRLPERLFTPYKIVTRENLDQFYRRDDRGKWRMNEARSTQLISASPSLTLLGDCQRPPLPSRIGFVKIFSSHEWYQNMERAMAARALELNIRLEVMDASQDRAREIDVVKRSIGVAAAGFINDGETVILDAGATTAYLAAALRDRENLQIITNSLPVLNTLADAPHIELVSTGGVVRLSSHSLTGPGAEASLRDLRADKVFLGGAGISEGFGLSNSNLAEASVKQAMIRAAREVVLLADHTKIGQDSLVKIAPLDKIHTLITDAGISTHDRLAFTQGGVDVVIADEWSGV